jgi:hypothetical protein
VPRGCCDPGLVHFGPPPACRATIRGTTVTLNRWSPGMAARGPLKAGLRGVDAALADLHRDGGELIVVPVRGVPWHERAEEALLRWAERVGHRRVWLPARVVDLGDGLPDLGWASVTCPACGAFWEDGTGDFWEAVRRDGWFPGHCLACGGSLPEWEVAPAPAGAGLAAARRGRTTGRRADSPAFAEADPSGEE